MPETRSKKSRKAEGYHTYRYEMTADDHAELLDVCTASKAMIMLSGYASGLYEERLTGWLRVEFAARAHRNSPRTELLWLNPLAAAAINAPQLQLVGIAA